MHEIPLQTKFLLTVVLKTRFTFARITGPLSSLGILSKKNPVYSL